MMKYQKGMSIIGIMFTAIGVIIVAMIAMKTLPVLSEYMDIKSTLAKLANESSSTEDEIRKKFGNQAIISDITSVKPQDLIIQTSQYAGSTISVKYRRDVPLAWNFGLYFDFDIKAGRTTGN